MRIMVVEDDVMTRRLLLKHLETWGFDADGFANGQLALDAFSDAFDIVITDWMMPELNGLELCQTIRGATEARYVYLILISTQDSQQDIIRGLKGGIDDYVVKPLDMDELRARVEIGIRVVSLERELQKRYAIIKNSFYQTIQMFSNLIEAFNRDLGGHCRRVADLAVRLAEIHLPALGSDLEEIRAAALLHDIGMVGFSESMILKRRVELNGDERNQYLTHPEQGEMILNEVDSLRPVAQLVRLHHEQYNGRGFPDGLAGEAIPMAAHIIAAASAYDGLVHKYHIELEDIPDQLNRQRGYQLHPDVVKSLLVINQEEISRERAKDSVAIPVEELSAGMVLSDGVHRITGPLVLPAWTTLTVENINKLQKYLELANISEWVNIQKASLRG